MGKSMRAMHLLRIETGRGGGWPGWGRTTLAGGVTVLVLVCSACTTTRDTRTGSEPVDVYYATDRQPEDEEGAKSFSGERESTNTLHYGVWQANIPRRRPLGEAEPRHTWLRGTADQRHTFSKTDFFAKLQVGLAKGQTAEILVFVHGYGTTFDEAISRAAQLSHDLEFGGVVVAYSWPSGGGTMGYMSDVAAQAWSEPHFRRFLADLRTRCGGSSVHILAHSMGARMVLRALESRGPPSNGAGRLKQLVFVAPDVDSGVFGEMAPTLAMQAQRTTLYASSNDRALWVSRKLHGGYARAGEAGEQTTVVQGIDIIDVSLLGRKDFWGHSYFSDNRAVLADLHGLVHDGRAPGDRFGLRRDETCGIWVLLP